MLKGVEQICRDHPGELLPPLLDQVIDFSLEELIKAPQDPLPASAILVALGRNHCNNVSLVYLHYIYYLSIYSTLLFIYH